MAQVSREPRRSRPERTDLPAASTRGWSDIAYQVAVGQAGRAWTLRGVRTQSGANGDAELSFPDPEPLPEVPADAADEEPAPADAAK